MPDDVAEEKVKALLALGAQVERVRPASIVDKKQVCTSHGSHTLTFVNHTIEQFVVSIILQIRRIRCSSHR